MKTNTIRLQMIAINVVLGASVLGSYAWGILAHPREAGALWGGVPAALVPFYTVNMLAAAAGYLAFSFFIIFRLDPSSVNIAGRFSYGAYRWLYVLILAPSVLWMPLTIALIGGPSPWLWAAIRVTLGLVGTGAVLLLASLIALKPGGWGAGRIAAFAGSVFFTIQTAVLDAIVWPAYFPVGL